MPFSFASEISRLVLSHDGDDETLIPKSPTLFSASSSPSLFSSLVDSTIVTPSLPQPSALPFPSPLSPTSTLRPTPILSSTPLATQPDTQQLTARMVELRSIDNIDAVAVTRENACLRRENECLKSEVTALRLQQEDDLQELTRLRLLHSPSSPTSQQQQQPSPSPLPPLVPSISKKKRQRMRKIERLANKAAAETTVPPGCESTRPAAAPPPPSSQPTAFIFHDSNLKHLTADELENNINSINKNNTHYNIKTNMTFTLSQTLDAIKLTTFKRNDIVVITTLTNDARHTKYRHARTPSQTKNMQAAIINHLKRFILPNNIVFLEAPPLLDTPSSDIYPYNKATYLLTQQHGVRLAETVLGEFHMFRDGYHILRNSRHLLVKALAAAVVNVNPHKHFKLQRPPHGNFGPWTSPNGQGLLPSPTVTYGRVAMAQPINFRRAAIRPLMAINIPRYRY